jgi:hypothetical protein
LSFDLIFVVVAVLNVLDKGGLVPWAVRQSLDVVRHEFRQQDQDAVSEAYLQHMEMKWD